MSKQLFLLIFLSVLSLHAAHARSDAEDKDTAKHPLDPSPSKFKISNIKPVHKSRLMSTNGEVAIEGFFMECPEKKTKSPVDLKVGVEVDQKKRPDIVLTDGTYFVDVIQTDVANPVEQLTIGKGRKLVDLEEGRSEIRLNLSPGKYSASTGFRSKTRTASGGWVSETCTFEILKD